MDLSRDGLSVSSLCFDENLVISVIQGQTTNDVW